MASQDQTPFPSGGGNGGRMHDRMERMPTRKLPADATVVTPAPAPPAPPPPSDAPQGSGSAKGYGAGTRAHWDLMDTIPNRQLSVEAASTSAARVHYPDRDPDRAHKDKLMYTRMGPSWPIRDRQLMVGADVTYAKPQQHAVKAGERMRKSDSGYALQERQLAADAHVVPPRSADADADGSAQADADDDMAMAAPRLHRHKVVRDLAWSLGSPNLMSHHCESLLEGGRVWLDEGAALVAASREWLEGLDDDPGPLLVWLRQQHGINRLGHYFSALIEYWIRHCMGVDPAFMVCRKQVRSCYNSAAALLPPLLLPILRVHDGHSIRSFRRHFDGTRSPPHTRHLPVQDEEQLGGLAQVRVPSQRWERDTPRVLFQAFR